MPRNVWFPYSVREGAPAYLVCLPHAGAGASVYRAWGAVTQEQTFICPVQPPGREGRIREQPYDAVAPFVRSLAPIVAAAIPEPFGLFGHSTGALTAFELAREMRRIGGPSPRHIFVAGRRAPHMAMPRTITRDTELDELRSILQRLGGTPEEVLRSDEMLRYLRPLLVADFCLNETYAFQAEEPLPVPITAFGATEDAWAGRAEMELWRQHTSAGFELRMLHGGHFAVIEQAAEVQAHMSWRLDGGGAARLNGA